MQSRWELHHLINTTTCRFASPSDCPPQVFAQLPPGIRSELLQERDPHGNVQVR